MRFFKRRSSVDGRDKAPVTLCGASVKAVERRNKPIKQYFYIIHVIWSDDTNSVIYRQYSQFHDLKCRLRHVFKKEAGAIEPSDRTLPFLPGRSVFRHGGSYMAAIQALDQYGKILVTMPAHIRNSQDVMEFFRTNDDDAARNEKGRRRPSGTVELTSKELSKPMQFEVYSALADYAAQSKDQVDLTQGLQVEVFEKHDTGWWLVSTEEGQGWAPSTYLEKFVKPKYEEDTIKLSPGNEEMYMVTAAHSPSVSDELALSAGAMVEVIEKSLDGWWLVRFEDKSGRVPAAKLMQAEKTKRRKSGSSTTLPNLPRKSSMPGDVRNDVTINSAYPQGSQTARPQVAPKPNTKATPTPRKPDTLGKPTEAGKPMMGCKCIVKWDFNPTSQGMAVKADEVLVLVEKSPEWWLMEKPDRSRGWVPANYLTSATSPAGETRPATNNKPVPSSPVHPASPTRPKSPVSVVQPSSPRHIESQSSPASPTKLEPNTQSPPKERWLPEPTVTENYDSPQTATPPKTHPKPIPASRSPGPAQIEKPTEQEKDKGFNTSSHTTNNVNVNNKLVSASENNISNKSQASNPLDIELNESGYFTVSVNAINKADAKGPQLAKGRKDVKEIPLMPSHRTPVSLDKTLGENPSPQQGATYNMGKVVTLPPEQLQGKPVYMARSNFTGGEENETDLEAGELVVVFERGGRGWWQVQSKGGLGWVPSHFLRNTAELFNSNKLNSEQDATPDKKEETRNTAESERQKLLRAPRELPDHTKFQRRQRDRIKATPIEAKVNKQLNKKQGTTPKNQPSLRILEDNLKPVDELLRLFNNED